MPSMSLLPVRHEPAAGERYTSTHHPLAVLAVTTISISWGGAGAWLAMRGIWRRIARTWVPRAHALGAELVAAAQQAIDAARKHSE
jgi:membrane protein YqaA with SNARE-associated domain